MIAFSIFCHQPVFTKMLNILEAEQVSALKCVFGHFDKSFQCLGFLSGSAAGIPAMVAIRWQKAATMPLGVMTSDRMIRTAFNHSVRRDLKPIYSGGAAVNAALGNITRYFFKVVFTRCDDSIL